MSTVAVTFCRPRPFRPVLAAPVLTVVYEVRNLCGYEALWLTNAVPNASYAHRGNGWTRVRVAKQYETVLREHLNENHHTYQKVAP